MTLIVALSLLTSGVRTEAENKLLSGSVSGTTEEPLQKVSLGLSNKLPPEPVSEIANTPVLFGTLFEDAAKLLPP